MSKKTTVEEVKETNNVVEPVNTDIKAKEAIETLRVQLKEHLQQAEYHRTMATKAQGALEVLLQLHPEEENSGEGSWECHNIYNRRFGQGSGMFNNYSCQ